MAGSPVSQARALPSQYRLAIAHASRPHSEPMIRPAGRRPDVDAAVEPRDAGLVGGVVVGRPLQLDGLAGAVLELEDSAWTATCPSPPGKYGLPVIAASTSAAARLNVLWPET